MKLGARVWGLGLVLVVGLVVGCGGNGAKATATVGASPVGTVGATGGPGAAPATGGDRDVTLFVAGAVVALGSSFITALFRHWLELRRERERREWELEQGRRKQELIRDASSAEIVAVARSKRRLSVRRGYSYFPSQRQYQPRLYPSQRQSQPRRRLKKITILVTGVVVGVFIGYVVIYVVKLVGWLLLGLAVGWLTWWALRRLALNLRQSQKQPVPQALAPPPTPPTPPPPSDQTPAAGDEVTGSQGLAGDGEPATGETP